MRMSTPIILLSYFFYIPPHHHHQQQQLPIVMLFTLFLFIDDQRWVLGGYESGGMMVANRCLRDRRKRRRRTTPTLPHLSVEPLLPPWHPHLWQRQSTNSIGCHRPFSPIAVEILHIRLQDESASGCFDYGFKMVSCCYHPGS